MQFLSTFESEQDTDIDFNIADDIDLTVYTSIFTIENLDSNSETLQALVLFGGYAAFSLLKNYLEAKVCALIVLQN